MDMNEFNECQRKWDTRAMALPSIEMWIREADSWGNSQERELRQNLEHHLLVVASGQWPCDLV